MTQRCPKNSPITKVLYQKNTVLNTLYIRVLNCDDFERKKLINEAEKSVFLPGCERLLQFPPSWIFLAFQSLDIPDVIWQ